MIFFLLKKIPLRRLILIAFRPVIVQDLLTLLLCGDLANNYESCKRRICIKYYRHIKRKMK